MTSYIYKYIYIYIYIGYFDFVIGIMNDSNTYSPKCSSSPKISSPMMATITVDDGLNAVMKTGPFSLMTNVWAYTVIPKTTIPCPKKKDILK